VKVLKEGMAKIKSLRDANLNHVDGLVLMGPPGCGKTFIMNRLELYAIAQQLHVMVTALTAQRARELGGIHLHTLFKLPVGYARTETPVFEAEKALLRLVNDPIATAYLRSLDVLFIDEVGMISMEMLATLNIILRKIRGNEVPFGGVLLIATGDFRQLAPVTGDLVWVSTELFTTFDIAAMKHLVRAMDDKFLQRLIEIDQGIELRDSDIEEYVKIITDPDTGAQFKASWDEVPVEYVRIVSKKNAVKEAVDDAMKTMLEQIEAENSAITASGGRQQVEVLHFKAEDQVESLVGGWMPADASVTKNLNYHLREQQELLLFKGAKVRFTLNDQAGRFSQGQVAIVEDFNRSYQDGRIGVKLKIARPGAQNINVGDGSQATVELLPIWSSYTVNARTGFAQARRKQLPLIPHGFSTIHKSIGQTHDGVATRLSVIDKNFQLWTREQLLVIVSRVKSLRNLIFVGPKQDNLNAIRQALRRVPRRWKEIAEMVRYKDVLQNPERVDSIPLTANAPLMVNPAVLPQENISGYVYFLMSSRNQRFGYVGQTNNLRRRVMEHNYPSSTTVQTDIPFNKPYIVTGYIIGFPDFGSPDENRVERRGLERYIEYRKKEAEYRNNRIAMTARELKQLGEDIVVEQNARPESGYRLTFVHCTS
jgi:hypothetical protein